MKLITIASIFLFVFLSTKASSQSNFIGQKQNGWEELGLKGKVKSMKASIFEGKDSFGKPEKGNLTISFFKSFNNNGYLVTSGMDSKESPDFSFKQTYTLDKNNQVILIKEFKSNGDLYVEERNSYNGQEKLVETNILYLKDDRTGKTTYKYDKAGNVLEEVAYKSGDLFSKRTWKYDDLNQTIEQNCYGKDGKLEEKTLYTYENNGQTKNETSFSSDGNTKGKTKWKYTADKKGVIEYTTYDKKGNKDYSALSDFNSKGKEIKTTVFSYDGDKETVTTSSYDDQGNLILSIKTKGEQILGKETYEYDKKGNLVTKVEYSGLEVKEITSYSYEYF